MAPLLLQAAPCEEPAASDDEDGGPIKPVAKRAKAATSAVQEDGEGDKMDEVGMAKLIQAFTIAFMDLANRRICRPEFPCDCYSQATRLPCLVQNMTVLILILPRLLCSRTV